MTQITSACLVGRITGAFVTPTSIVDVATIGAILALVGERSRHHSRQGSAAVTILIETDSRSRAVIPGHSNQRFLLQENEDGSLLLQPASVVTDAQHEYAGDPELTSTTPSWTPVS